MGLKSLVLAGLLAATVLPGWPGTAAAQPAAPAASGVDERLRAMLPERFRAAGRITAITNPTSPPYNFYDRDNTTLIGLEQDLAAEMGRKLGVRFDFAPAGRSSQTSVVAVQSGRYDMGIGAIGDNLEREKIVDMVAYTAEATGIAVPTTNPHNIRRISDLCGRRAASVQGTIPLLLLEKQAGLCPAGRPMEVMPFPGTDQLFTALRSGRVDAFMSTYGVTDYILKNQETQGGQAMMVIPGARYAVGLQAMVVAKENPELRDAIQATLNAMVADGSYRRIFEKWGMGSNMLERVEINGAARFADYMKLDE